MDQWNQRRPLNATLLAIRLVIFGGNVAIVKWLQAIATGLAGAWLAICGRGARNAVRNPKESIGNFVLIDCLHHLPRPARFLRQVTGAEIMKIEISEMLVYPAAGGFSYYSLLPSSVLVALHPLERSWIADRVGLRMLVVIQKG